MFLNILRISASNVLKMFLYIIVTIGCTFAIFHSHKQTGSINTLNKLTATLAGEKQYSNKLKWVDGCYTNLLRRVQNISWRKHFTLSQIYGDLQPLSVTLTKRRAQFAGHAFRANGEIISDMLLWKASTGRKLTFPDTISRDTGIKVRTFLQPWQIRLFGAKLWVKSRPRPQDNDDDDDDDE